MFPRPIVKAPPNIPCEWTHSYGPNSNASHCESGKPAVHVLLQNFPVAPAGSALCAYHSPFDVTPED